MNTIGSFRLLTLSTSSENEVTGKREFFYYRMWVDLSLVAAWNETAYQDTTAVDIRGANAVNLHISFDEFTKLMEEFKKSQLFIYNMQ